VERWSRSSPPRPKVSFKSN